MIRHGAPHGRGDRVTEAQPFDLFREWYAEASRSSVVLPNAMGLSTVGADGAPSSRMVLLSSFDRRGFVFHTNYESDKGRQISGSRRAALLFWWEPLDRQVRIEGAVEKTSPEESDAYFSQRPRGSRIGAWASDQSRPLSSRETLEARMRGLEKEFGDGPIPRPPHWGGYRVVPVFFEFWRGGGNRLHDRIRFLVTDSGWESVRLYP
ncbi:MAG: pyridoxamine 5-phosphate oxidase [Deltaproteobacteria bacterium]|nr:pyridoxamine 5-phosphate oxidase [Deltaproteobacteria bacterium]